MADGEGFDLIDTGAKLGGAFLPAPLTAAFQAVNFIKDPSKAMQAPTLPDINDHIDIKGIKNDIFSTVGSLNLKQNMLEIKDNVLSIDVKDVASNVGDCVMRGAEEGGGKLVSLFRNAAEGIEKETGVIMGGPLVWANKALSISDSPSAPGPK